MTETLNDLETADLTDFLPYKWNEDPDRRTHIINPPTNTHIWKPGMSAQDIVDVARLTGQNVTALSVTPGSPITTPRSSIFANPA